MIAPAMATMLCVVTTDAVLDARADAAHCWDAVDRSFNRITVDGEMSTNDSVLFLASGASGCARQARSWRDRRGSGGDAYAGGSDDGGRRRGCDEDHAPPGAGG